MTMISDTQLIMLEYKTRTTTLEKKIAQPRKYIDSVISLPFSKNYRNMCTY